MLENAAKCLTMLGKYLKLPGKRNNKKQNKENVNPGVRKRFWTPGFQVFPNAHAFAYVHLHVRMDKYRIVGVLVAVDIRTSKHTRFFVACGVGHLTSFLNWSKMRPGCRFCSYLASILPALGTPGPPFFVKMSTCSSNLPHYGVT